MKHKIYSKVRKLFLFTIFILLPIIPSFAQTTQFTYQGKLSDSGTPLNGSYDFVFTLWDAATNGTQIGSLVSLQNTQVVNGIFSVQLDFGVAAFSGATRYLEITVKPSGNPGLLPTLLSPRQLVTSTPYAIKSLGAVSADSLSVNCVSCITSNQIAALDGSKITGTISVGSIPAGSTNYIQNTTSLQASSNFNISGTGRADTIDVTTQYNLGGSRILGNAGTNNLFAGVNSGTANAGANNSFFGKEAGRDNTSGASNAFFGSLAGAANTIGFANAFFGANAGAANTTAHSNSFFGYGAGTSTTGGVANSYFGRDAGQSNVGGSNNTAVGYRAGKNAVSVSDNAFFGYQAGLNTTASGNAFFGSNAGFGNTTGFNNAFFGTFAGQANTGGVNNSFFGSSAGSNNGTASNNAFFGSSAGAANTGNANAFFGSGAGSSNTTAGNNSFFGSAAGSTNTTGNSNAFFGTNAGVANLTGSLNAFFGANAGQANSTGANNSFFGFNSGFTNTGNNNSFFGSSAGRNNGIGFNNSFFGYQAGFSNSGNSNAFFGYVAGFANNSGNSNAFFGASSGASNISGSSNSFFGKEAGRDNLDGIQNTFVGAQAGLNNASGNDNAFFGESAGGGNTTGGSNTFVGTNAGLNNDSGSSNTIIGTRADVIVSNLTNATAVGFRAAVGSSNALVLGSINGVNGATADTKVGIGTTSPTTPLTIRTANNVSGGVYGWSQTNDDITMGSRVGGTGAQPYGGWIGTKTNHPLNFFVNNSASPVITLETSGFVRLNAVDIGGSGPSLCLNSNSRISFCSSSLRYKTDLQSFTGGLDIVNRLRPITFTWKVGGMRDIGFGAEEVAAVEPLLTFRNPKGEIEGVKYAQISAVLVNAVKEQQAQIASQQQQITDLKTQLHELAMLKKLVCADHPQAEICTMQ